MSPRRRFVLLIPFALGLASDAVVGSVPASVPSQAALFEAQGEWKLASGALAALTATDSATAMARVRVAMRRGDVSGALASLGSGSARIAAADAALVRGALLLASGDAAAALTALESQSAPAGLASWASLLAAEAAVALERWDAVRARVAAADVSLLPPEARLRWALVRARLALATGDSGTLDELAEAISDAAQRDDRGGLVLWAMARQAAQRGDVARARAFRLALLEARPTPAESAYADLRRAPLDASLAVPLARFEMRSDRHESARTRLRGALGAGLAAPQRADARLLLAESWLKSGEPRQCLKALERAASDTRGTSREAERLRLQARAYKALGQRDTAMRTYKQLAARFPHHERADDALYEVGWLLETARRFRDAEHAYMHVSRAYARGSLADDALLRAGLAALRSHRPSEAAEHFSSLIARHSRSPLVDNALYWQMLSQIELRDAAGALVLRDRLERDYPRSYFSVLARRRVERGLAAPVAPPSEAGAGRTLASDLEPGALFAARAVAAWQNAVASLRQAWGAPSSAFAAESRAWRFWLDWGFADAAEAETRRLERRFETEPAAVLELLARNHERGSHGRLVRLAHILDSRHGTDPALDGALDVLAFPAPYAPSFVAEASRRGLAHATLLGLARQESAFDAHIDSPAGARGLMQIMPGVGRRLAPRTGDTPFHSDALYDPDVNIRMGCLLLADELAASGGDLAQALAAYNAGGDRAATWKSRLAPGEPPELYTDLVEFYETRTYLETVLGNAEVYRRLYALP